MRMRMFYMPTLRELPQEAETPSHQLLLRAGMIRKSASGIYTFLPLGYRVLRKIEQIVREEMDRAGSQEIRMSAIQPREIWEKSGRWANFGPEMFKLKDRHDRDFCLGPTAEEYFTSLIDGEVTSYKQLPLNLYQIQWKYRDEKRPRFGINRSREFLMKDAYSYDVDEEGLEESYKIMWKAYEKVFDRLDLDYRVVEGDNGAMGGSGSHEFTALSEVGEGTIFYCSSCSYAATDEIATMKKPEIQEEEEKALEEMNTPSMKTIEDLEKHLGISAKKMMKAICLMVQEEPVLVFLPGHKELNISKVVSYLQIPEHEIAMMDDAMIEEITGAEPGFTGPVGLKKDVRMIFDKQLTLEKNLICGGNKKDVHLANVNYPRDFEGEICDDLWMVEEGDLCPLCASPMKSAKGIEVGNIFKLGKKYSHSLGTTFLDEQGKAREFVMGSYGIGISRSISAVVEQNHDDQGIIWPLSCAPYHVMISIIKVDDEEQMALAEKLEKTLEDMAIEVFVDDRKERPGVKFNDRDLIGIPLRITVGRKAKEGMVEFSTRKEGEVQELSIEETLERIQREMNK